MDACALLPARLHARALAYDGRTPLRLLNDVRTLEYLFLKSKAPLFQGVDPKRCKEVEDAFLKDLHRRMHDGGRAPPRQCSGAVGERAMHELLLLMGHDDADIVRQRRYPRPDGRSSIVPDFSLPHLLLEVKMGTLYTPGTAHEKILGAERKYLSLPAQTGKPVWVVCMGRAEDFMRAIIDGSSCETEQAGLTEHIQERYRVYFKGFEDVVRRWLDDGVGV